MAAPIFEFVNKDIGEHTFHTGDPWPKEEKKDVVFHAFQQQVPGTEPVYDFWNDKDKEHTFHFGEPWPNEQKGEHPVFYAYPLGDDKNGLLQPVYSFWNPGEKKHSVHLGDARAGEDKHEPMFLALKDPLAWKSGAICDGAPAENRAKWLMENNGMKDTEAQAFVMGEFPSSFAQAAPAWKSGVICDGVPAENRVKWLMENKGMKEAEAQAAVMKEFPQLFGGSSGHFVDGKFPHTMELVKDAAGKSRVKFSVTPTNPGDVTMIAVHYSVNGEPGKEDMNFDINKPQEGTQTYVHVTPDFGPVCEPGSKVTYWLAAMEKGIITEMPEKACPVKENRMTWTAQ